MDNLFTKIGAYQYSSEAIIIKGRLEAEDIEVFMADNYTIDTDPLVSNAIGGVKLFVKTEDFEKAAEILNSISKYSLDNNGKPVICPVCQSTKVEVGSTIKDLKSLLVFIFTFLLVLVLPLYIKYKYRCSKCGNEFNIQ